MIPPTKHPELIQSWVLDKSLIIRLVSVKMFSVKFLADKIRVFPRSKDLGASRA